MCFLQKWLNNFYFPDNSILVLDYIDKFYENKSAGVEIGKPAIKYVLKDRFKEDEVEEKTTELLIGLKRAGYVSFHNRRDVQSEIALTTIIGITEKGKLCREDYYDFKIKSTFKKILCIIEKYFTSIISLVALLVSIAALLK